MGLRIGSSSFRAFSISILVVAFLVLSHRHIASATDSPVEDCFVDERPWEERWEEYQNRRDECEALKDQWLERMTKCLDLYDECDSPSPASPDELEDEIRIRVACALQVIACQLANDLGNYIDRHCDPNNEIQYGDEECEEGEIPVEEHPHDPPSTDEPVEEPAPPADEEPTNEPVEDPAPPPADDEIFDGPVGEVLITDARGKGRSTDT